MPAIPQGIADFLKFKHVSGLDSWKRVFSQNKQRLLFQRLIGVSLSFSGSDQAREGRLVDALAVKGDEGRDTLR